jgi:acetyltransferase-like isoleucine patch superfamily enzyme
MMNKIFQLILKRPLFFLRYLRQYCLFQFTHGIYKIFPPQGIRRGRNVRIQSLRCLQVELPEALIQIGDDCIIYENAKIEAYGKGHIDIGQGSIIGDARMYARESIQIGRGVVTSWNVFIQDYDPHPTEAEQRKIQVHNMTESFIPCYKKRRELKELSWKFPTSSIVIGDNVWLGANTTILRGAHIGDDCIVATGAVVTAGHYPKGSILAGVPAKVLKTLE